MHVVSQILNSIHDFSRISNVQNVGQSDPFVSGRCIVTINARQPEFDKQTEGQTTDRWTKKLNPLPQLGLARE